MSDTKAVELRRKNLLSTLQDEEAPYMDYLQRLAPEKRARISRHLGRMRHGMHAVAPLTCMGPARCPFINHCPIPSIEQKQQGQYGPDEDFPMMMPCVMETMYQRQKINDYIDWLKVDPDNPIEMAIVNELSIIDLRKTRALMIQSEGDRDGEGRDFLRQDRDWKEAGDTAYEVFTTNLHPIEDVLDRLERRRERLIERLGETRKHQQEMDIKRGNKVEDSNVLKEIQAVRQFLQEASVRTSAPASDEAIMIDD